MSRIRSSGTGPERKMRGILEGLGYSGWEENARGVAGTPDFLFREAGRAVFVHGCMWHGHGCSRPSPALSSDPFWKEKVRRNRERDGEAKAAFDAAGWGALEVWECELRARDLPFTAARVDAFLQGLPLPPRAGRPPTREIAAPRGREEAAP